MKVAQKWVSFIMVGVAIPCALRAESTLTVEAVVKGGMAVPQASLIAHSYDIGGGYSLPKAGYSIAGEVHVGIEGIPFVVNLGGSTTFFSNSGVVLNPSSASPERQDYTVSMHIVSIDIGLQYRPITIGMLEPYIGSNAKLSFFGGSLHNDGVPGSLSLDMNAATRFGIDFAAGTQFSIAELPFAFDIQAKYTMANLIGKQFDTANSGYELLDGKNPSSLGDQPRAINYTTVSFGVVFSIF